MFSLTSYKLVRATAFAVVGGVALLAASPAMALCRYGTGNCVNPHSNPAIATTETAPTIDGTGNGWQDPDCRFYGNCLSDNRDNGCWYVNGACRSNPQTPERVTPDRRTPPTPELRLQPRR